MFEFGYESVCIGCGCTDMHACEDGCHWLAVDREEGIGVCSSCAECLKEWNSAPRGLLVRKMLIKDANSQIAHLLNLVASLRTNDLNAFGAMSAAEQETHSGRKDLLVEAYHEALSSLESAKNRLEQV